MTFGNERGFTLVELLVSTVVMLVITGAVFGLMDPAQGTYRAQPEVSDMQQRLRVAANALHEDLMMAGAGTYLGGSGGSLLNIMAPVVPRRLGGADADLSATVFRPDAISIMYVPTTAAQTTIVDAMPQPSAEIKVNTVRPGCQPTDPKKTNEPCGFKEGMPALIFDDTGAFDWFTITQVQNSDHLQHKDPFSKSYQPGAQVVQIQWRTYYLKTEPSTNTFQLRYYDGGGTDVPMVDNVVALAFDYLGERRGPVVLKPILPTSSAPLTSYGPPPPMIGKDIASDSWPAGENCAFKVDPDGSNLQVSRLPDMPPVAEALALLPPAMLTDGPWCPDAGTPWQFDADLLRVRTISVRLRVQVASATMRGPAGVLFTRGGTSTGGMTFVPDQEIRFSVSPRNMNFGR